MKKYIVYILLGIVLIAGVIYYSTYAKRSNAPAETDNNSAMNHDNSNQPIAQSHRSYTLQVTSSTNNVQPGQPTKFTYKIVNDKNEVVKDFALVHEKIMHFLLVRKDLQNFQHLHPDFNQNTGEFSVTATFPTDGPYRLFPDFTPAPENFQKLPVTLTQDVAVGDVTKYKPQPVATEKGVEKMVDGYRVTYYLPEKLSSQTELDYSLVVEQSGQDQPVQLEPYLGAMGHGVIIREGTLDFIHTHAGDMGMTSMEGMTAAEHAGHQGEPDTMDFSTMFPEPGTYKIFTQFQIKGKVYTSDYTLKVN